MDLRPGVVRDKLLHQCRDTISSLQQDLEQEKQIREQLRTEFSYLKDKHSAVLEELFTSRAKNDAWANELAELKEQFSELQHQELELRTRNVHLATLNESYAKELAETSETIAGFWDALAKAEREAGRLRELLANSETRGKLLEAENATLRVTYGEMSDRLSTVSQHTERNMQDKLDDLKTKYDMMLKEAVRDLHEKHALEDRLNKEKARSSYEQKLNSTKKELSDFYEEQLVHMRKRLDALSNQLELKQRKAAEFEETISKVRETETNQSLNWEEKSSRYLRKTERLQSDLNDTGEKYDILLEENNELKAELNKTKKKAKALESEKAKLVKDLECLKTEAVSVIQERNSVSGSAYEQERTIQSLRGEIQALIKADELNRDKLVNLEEERDQLRSTLQRYSERLRELELARLQEQNELDQLRLKSAESSFGINVKEYLEIVEQLNEDRAHLAQTIEQLEQNFKNLSVKFNRERSSRETLHKELSECTLELKHERELKQKLERELFRVSSSPILRTDSHP